jgi:hypothetical protein
VTTWRPHARRWPRRSRLRSCKGQPISYPLRPGFRVAAGCDELALKLDRALTEGEDEFIEKLGAANR